MAEGQIPIAKTTLDSSTFTRPIEIEDSNRSEGLSCWLPSKCIHFFSVERIVKYGMSAVGGCFKKAELFMGLRRQLTTEDWQNGSSTTIVVKPKLLFKRLFGSVVVHIMHGLLFSAITHHQRYRVVWRRPACFRVTPEAAPVLHPVECMKSDIHYTKISTISTTSDQVIKRTMVD